MAPVRSFDLFDTLIGRLHYSPESTFALVEKRFPYPGFSFFRMAAERKSNHTLPDIYRVLQKLTGISDQVATNIMECELEMEKGQIFPILENIALVQEGDLVVSDTYYNTDQLHFLLEKLPFLEKVYLYPSPDGKQTGAAWALLKGIHSIERHLGDSLHSDVNMAGIHGIQAVHYTNGGLSAEEQFFFDLGHKDLSYLCRAVRLSNPYVPGSTPWLLWNDQCKYNIPILIQASIFLHAFCQTHRKSRILFTSRDCCLWIQVFRQLFPNYDSVYFHASRHTYRFPTSSYIEYVRDVYTDDSVIVDGHGKGRSSELFFQNALHREHIYLSIINTGLKHHAIVRSEILVEQIEMLNYDTCGTLVDVKEEIPHRCEPEYPLEYVFPSHACVKKSLEFLPSFHFEQFEPRIMDWAVQSIRSNLTLPQILRHARYHCHLSEENQLYHFHI